MVYFSPKKKKDAEMYVFQKYIDLEPTLIETLGKKLGIDVMVYIVGKLLQYRNKDIQSFLRVKDLRQITKIGNNLIKFLPNHSLFEEFEKSLEVHKI